MQITDEATGRHDCVHRGLWAELTLLSSFLEIQSCTKRMDSRAASSTQPQTLRMATACFEKP